MEPEFSDDDLEQLATERDFTMGLPAGLVKAYRKRYHGILAAKDERDLYAMNSWRLEKLKGSRQHQHSMRLNDQYRLIIEIIGAGSEKRIRIVGIEDYH